jgi:hypothetical protein
MYQYPLYEDNAPRSRRWVQLAPLFVVSTVLFGCAAPQSYDYTAFKSSRPKSMLILPPVNDSPEVSATAGVMTAAALPLAEAGYYVMPVGLVDEAFKQNGMTNANEIQGVASAKLREIFGADAAVYIRVKEYGTKYMVISSDTRVTVEGKIVDLRTGQQIWAGSATASSTEGQSNSGGLVGLLVAAVVNQIAGTATDASFKYAAVANYRLLGAPIKNGVLYGPRSPNYQRD